MCAASAVGLHARAFGHSGLVAWGRRWQRCDRRESCEPAEWCPVSLLARLARAFSFDGVDDWLLVANSPVLNFGPGQDFSLEAWIAPISSSTTFGILSIFDKRVVPDISHCLGYEFNLVDGKSR